LVGLQKSRRSLEAQTFTGWEHIIVDGNSNDGTFDYLDELPPENTRFISEPDRGIYDAMNKAWKFAEPESYVFYLNARDVLADVDSLQKAHDSLLLSQSAEWGCTTHEEVDQNGDGWVCKLVSRPSIRNQLYAYGYRSHQGVVMKARFIESLGGFDDRFSIAADWDLIARALMKSQPWTWRYPMAKFELGGESSVYLLKAHQELRTIRQNFLITNRKEKLFDDIWCAIYLRNLGYRNYLSWVLDLGVKLNRKFHSKRIQERDARPAKQNRHFLFYLAARYLRKAVSPLARTRRVILKRSMIQMHHQIERLHRALGLLPLQKP
jgi:glycosyltransferase involved in cell wall biosynthesis